MLGEAFLSPQSSQNGGGASKVLPPSLLVTRGAVPS
jgi:hypothetical protein